MTRFVANLLVFILATGCMTAAPGLDEASARAELERAYTAQREALLAKDFDAVMALRTPDFETFTPDGARHGPEEMAMAMRNFLSTVEWVDLSNRLGAIAITDEGLAVEVDQHTIRRGMRDGRMRRIENWVTQRETWIRTPEGLRLRRVDNIRDQCVLFDGALRDASQEAGCRARGIVARPLG